MDEYGDFYGLPWVDQSGYVYGIVPVDDDRPRPSGTPEATTNAPSYETPPWIDTINRAIERAAQVATLEVAGYPPYPSFPAPSPSPTPTPLPGPGIQPQQQGTVNIPTNLLIWGGVFLAFFMLGKGRR